MPTAPTPWPAVAAIFAYLWFELAYHSTDSPRALAVVLFTKLADMAPLFRDDASKLRLRPRLPG